MKSRKIFLPGAFVVATGEIVVVLDSSVTALPAVVVVLAVVLTDIINGEKERKNHVQFQWQY